MKKIIAVLSLPFLLTACNVATNEKNNYQLTDIGDIGYPSITYDLMRDQNTGCVYLREKSAHAYPLTPYYGEDGKVVGCGNKDLDKSKYQ